MSSSGRRAHKRVEFDELAWSEDIAAASPSARVVAVAQRERLERDGQLVADIRAWGSRGPGRHKPPRLRQGVPASTGWPVGHRVRFAKGADGRPYLLVIAFGVRHPPAKSRQPSVYERAHRRLQNA